MATPVGGATTQGGPTTSFTFFLVSPVVGELVVFFFLFDGPVTGLTAGPQPGQGAGALTAGPVVGNLYSFYGVMPSGPSPYWTASWTNSVNYAVVAERYTNATQISSTNFVTASGNSGTATASLTTDDTLGDTVVAGIGNASNNPLTTTVGNERQQTSSTNACRLALIDNSNGSPGSLGCTATMTSSPWDVILLELRYVIAAVITAGFDVKGNLAGQGMIPGNTTTSVELGNAPSGPSPALYGQGYPTGDGGQ